jgi:pimeloyl-ACP methyl ester carboxylesterase
LGIIGDVGEAENAKQSERGDPAKVRPKTVKVQGCKTAFFRKGSGRTVMFLHGDRGGSVWLDMLEELSKKYDVIAPHHPGFGESDTPEWFKNVHDLAYFYLEFMREMDLNDVHIVGQGIGGWIAAEIAIRSTERIKSITLVSSYGIRLKGVQLADIFLWNREETTRHLFHDGSIADRILEQSFSEEDFDQFTKDKEGAARIGFAPRFLDPHLEKWLNRVRVPVLIIWGRHDQLLPVDYAEYWASKLPDARVEIFESSGHLPYVEDEGKFLETVEKFIEGASK